MMAAGGERENPHDAIFRAVVGVPANAAGVLASALPTAATQLLALLGPHPVPASSVDPDRPGPLLSLRSVPGPAAARPPAAPSGRRPLRRGTGAARGLR